MIITTKDAIIQYKMFRRNVRDLDKLGYKIEKLKNKQKDPLVRNAIMVDMFHIADTFNQIPSGNFNNIKELLDANAVIIDSLIKTINLYNDIKDKKYNKKVSNEDYQMFIFMRTYLNDILSVSLTEIMGDIMDDIFGKVLNNKTPYQDDEEEQKRK